MSRTPEELVSQASQLLNRGRWREVAELCDGESLRRFRKLQIAAFTGPLIERGPGEWRSAIIDHFARVETIEELEALDATETFTRYLEACTNGYQIERLLRLGRISADKYAEFPVEIANSFTAERVVGHVEDGELAYVVCSPDLLSNVPSPEGDEAPPAWPEHQRRNWRAEIAQMAAAYPIRRQPDGSWALLAHVTFLAAGRAFLVGESGEGGQ